MNAIQTGVITLLRSAITGEKYPLPEDFDIEAALPQINRHHMATLAFEGAVNCGIPKDHPTMRLLFQAYCKALLKSEGQLREIKRIFAAFEENAIEYMPLKGCNMKALYPKPELRVMGDADVLIRVEQYDKIVPIMKNLGFEMQVESDHELVWKSKNLLIELHKRLIPSYNKDFFAYFGDGWKLAKVHQDHRWFMQPEDEFVYLFTHFAKHFRDGGIGCRHVVDLWVWLRAEPGLDVGAVEDEMKKLHLLEFYRNIRRLIAVWFEDGQSDDRLDFITQYILASGSWGNLETKQLSIGVRDMRSTNSSVEVKARYVWRMLFPTLTAMRNIYPVLHKLPWLLPFAWVHRVFCKLFIWRAPLDRHKQTLGGLTQDKLDERSQALEYMGIGYHF